MNRKHPTTRRLSLEPLEDRSLLSAGFLDPSFDGDGVVISDVGYNENVHAVAVYADGTADAGKILVAGDASAKVNGSLDFALVRYNSDGSLDSTFGKGGIAIRSLVSGTDRAFAVALVGDKILVGGFASNSPATGIDFGLAHFNADGTFDQTFGTKGKVLTDFGSGTHDFGMTMAVQADGKILLAGITEIGTGGVWKNVFEVARYTAAGKLDTTFGNG